MKKIKIIIAGIGGVGGYFGGLLEEYFYDSKNVEISFVACGEQEIPEIPNIRKISCSEQEVTDCKRTLMTLIR